MLLLVFPCGRPSWLYVMADALDGVREQFTVSLSINILAERQVPSRLFCGADRFRQKVSLPDGANGHSSARSGLDRARIDNDREQKLSPAWSLLLLAEADRLDELAVSRVLTTDMLPELLRCAALGLIAL